VDLFEALPAQFKPHQIAQLLRKYWAFHGGMLGGYRW